MLLFLFFLFSQRAGTCALPILSPSPLEAPGHDPAFDIATTASTGACAGRSLWDILWSCLATTFACTWVSVHPNIPFLRESKASTRRWRVYLMLVSLIAPEIMILWACKQLQGALVIMKTVNSSYWVKVLERDWVEPVDPKTKTKTARDKIRKTEKASKQKEKNNSPLWTLTHAQYLQMGGYRLQCLTSEEKLIPSRYGRHTKAMFAGGERDVWELPLSFETMKATFNKGHIDIPFIRKDEILDKNGRDGLSKAIAMLQLTWFIIQIAARIRQGLAVTELELTTAALASLNIAMYISWWSKPTDILCPTIITTKGLQDQDRRWMHNVSLPPSPPEATQVTDSARSLPPTPPEPTQVMDGARSLLPSPPEPTQVTESARVSSSPPDPELHYVISQVGDKERVNLATHYWDEFTKALRESLIFIAKSPADIVLGFFDLASQLGGLIRGIWASPYSATHDAPSKASEITLCSTLGKKVRDTISLIWTAVAYLFLALIYYPILAIVGSGKRSQLRPDDQGEQSITMKDVQDKTTIRLLFKTSCLRFIMDMAFFCEDVASAPFSCLSAFAGAIFGMIHCLAWNFDFPSYVELILWRTCSSIIAGICILIMVVALGYIIFKLSGYKATPSESPGQYTPLEDPSKHTTPDIPRKRSPLEGQSKLTSSEGSIKPTASGSPASKSAASEGSIKPTASGSPSKSAASDSSSKPTASDSSRKPAASDSSSKPAASDSSSKPTASGNTGENSSEKIIEVACSVFAICFVLTRLSLLTLSVIQLRSLPASAFDTVQWSGFIPHI